MKYRAEKVAPRCGQVSMVSLAFLLSVIAVVVLTFLGMSLRTNFGQVLGGEQTVRVYAASSVASPLSQVIEEFNRASDVRVELVRSGGSGELAGQIKTEFETGVEYGADIFVSADQELLSKLESHSIVHSSSVLALQSPVVAVRGESEIQLKDLTDLVSSNEIRFGVASERAAIGKAARQIAIRIGIEKELIANQVVDAENVMTLAQALVSRSIDAAIVWDTTVHQVNQSTVGNESSLLKVALPLGEPNYDTNISVGLVANDSKSENSTAFKTFLVESKTSREIFKRFHFRVPNDLDAK